MIYVSHFPARLLLAALAFLSFGLEVESAQAQAESCSRLAATLRNLERTGDFREVERNSRAARSLAAELQDAESAYVRTGCNDRAKAGETLTGNCRALARQINNGRAQMAELSGQLETGNAIAQQREAILQEISRFGCGTGNSEANFEDGRTRRDGLFDRLFGDFTGEGGDFMEGDIVGDEFGGFGGGSTVRTVCVRACDGYFWPVSYSTLPDYVGNDAGQCQAQCPGSEVNLYYYNNPGQEPEQMVDLLGQPYSASPNAFRYRREFDASCSCKALPSTGVVTLAGGQYGQSRAVIDFNGTSFPLPLRDPRGQTPVALATAELQPPADGAVYVSVPLPRRRPAAPGEEPVAQAVALPSEDQTRIVKFGDKTVRIVGPDTPYAQPVEEETEAQARQPGQ